MKKYIINGLHIVEGRSLSDAVRTARKAVGEILSIEEITRTTDPKIPGEREYTAFLDWQRAANAQNQAWRAAAWHEKTELEPDQIPPECPLDAAALEAAREYARFLGAVVLRDFDTTITAYRTNH